MKITILFEEEYLGVYPSIINAITLLSNKFESIRILTSERKSNFPKPPKFKNNVFFYKIRQYSDYNRNSFDVSSQSSPEYEIFEVQTSFWKQLIPEFIKIEYRKFRNLYIENIDNLKPQIKLLYDKVIYCIFCYINTILYRPNIIIAIDGTGLVAGTLLKLFTLNKVHLVFWSLEIDTRKSPLLFSYFYEKIISICAKYTDTLVVQEQTRLKVLKDKLNYKFHCTPTFLIPHSPLDSKDDSTVETQFFHNMFSLSKEEKVILHAGWIHDAMCVDKMAGSAKFWKPQFRLVFHEREKRSPDENFIRHVCGLSGNKLLLSLNPVPFEEIDKVFSSAQIGIIAYEKNYGGGRENAHKASGKLGHFLKSGVPVIALDLPGYREMFVKYKCGMIFESFDEIQTCIEKIFSDYELYKFGALRCFQNEFEFEKFFNPFSLHLLRV